MLTKLYNIIGLGEVLWDCFPAGRQLGGAPANFAYVANKLGERGLIASRVGTDSAGQALLAHLTECGLGTDYIQRDQLHETSHVEVAMGLQGQPSYNIPENVAWDYLEWTPHWASLAQEADAVCFGTLAQRSPRSRSVIRQFVSATKPQALRIFDVNLRQAFFDTGVLDESLHLADACKLNDEELPRLAQALGTGGSNQEAQAVRLREAFNLKFVCLTRGAGGSLLLTDSHIDNHSGIKVQVADTVGAGDAFTATLVCSWLRGKQLSHINEAANRVGAWVASQVGGMPPLIVSC